MDLLSAALDESGLSDFLSLSPTFLEGDNPVTTMAMAPPPPPLSMAPDTPTSLSTSTPGELLGQLQPVTATLTPNGSHLAAIQPSVAPVASNTVVVKSSAVTPLPIAAITTNTSSTSTSTTTSTASKTTTTTTTTKIISQQMLASLARNNQVLRLASGQLLQLKPGTTNQLQTVSLSTANGARPVNGATLVNGKKVITIKIMKAPLSMTTTTTTTTAGTANQVVVATTVVSTSATTSITPTVISTTPSSFSLSNAAPMLVNASTGVPMNPIIIRKTTAQQQPLQQIIVRKSTPLGAVPSARLAFIPSSSSSPSSSSVIATTSSSTAPRILQLQQQRPTIRIATPVVASTVPAIQANLQQQQQQQPPPPPPPPATATSLIGANTAAVTGRRISAKPKSNPNSRPGSPQQSNRREALKSAPSAEEQADRAIMLEEVKRLLEEQEDEELTNLETFADYMPSKLKIGKRHPDLIVETASLASIPPPDVYYRLAIPDEPIDEGRLSALQLESIIYASQQHETTLADGSRAGFLIGDGAGVGKGRTVAGIIYENYLRGRKRALWFSVSADLKFDAERDLYDIGAGAIEVYQLNKFKYGFKINSPENENVRKGVVFSTYSSLIGESTTNRGQLFATRFNQIVQWCGEDFDGPIIFDECHKAKNLFPGGAGTRPSKTGQAVLELQRRLPRARVVYASATGATEPKNMGYMTRLGIWGPGTPFEDFASFVQTVERRGVGAMELVAIDLKMRGMYMARQLSFKGVTFRIEHVPLSREFIRLYNCCCRLWVSAKARFEKALELMEAETAVAKAVWTQFWGAHQRFFKYLCIASKVRFAVAFVKEALRANKAIVIGLQSTGEARTLEVLEDSGGELNDFVSTAKSVFQSLVEKHFPAPNRKKLAKLLGRDTSFFEQFGIKLSRDDNDQIVVGSMEEDEEEQTRQQGLKKARSFFEAEAAEVSSGEDDEDSDDDDDFISVSEEEEDDLMAGISNGGDNGIGGDSSSDIDSDDLDAIDDIMDEKLGLKRKRGGGGKKTNGSASNAVKFMDILLGPSSAAAKRKRRTRRKKKKAKKRRPAKKARTVPGGSSRAAAAAANRRRSSMRNKYEKFYAGFDAVGEDVGGYCERLRDELMQQLESFGERLPPNTLDELIDELGGPEAVAEMTGRKGRVVSTEDGQVHFEARADNDVSPEMLNIREKQRFMDDEKRVAIISEAASSGISLHADRRAINKWRRVHITVELPWSADRAIQQFGRTHRSNQVSAPEYVFLISNLAGEKRFASIVAKRLESLGALTHGDRRATESRDLSQFNIDTKYGRQALEIVMRRIARLDSKTLVPEPEHYSGEDFFDDCREGLAGVGLLTICRRTGAVTLDKDYANINRFLNRLLGLEVELQNTLFRYFNDTMEAVIKTAKRSGKYDAGIIDLSSEVGNVVRLSEESFILKSASGATKIQLHAVAIDRGLPYEKALNMYKQALQEEDYFKEDVGFYTTDSPHQIRKIIFLALPETGQSKTGDARQIFRIYKPSLGQQSKYETKSSLHERGTKVADLEEAARLWSEHYALSEDRCTHQLLFGRCRGRTHMATPAPVSGEGGFAAHFGPNMTLLSSRQCDAGLRRRTYCILSGSVLTVWPEVEKQIPSIQSHKLQIVRLKTDDGKKYIGPMVPPFLVTEVRNCLQQMANGGGPAAASTSASTTSTSSTSSSVADKK